MLCNTKRTKKMDFSMRIFFILGGCFLMRKINLSKFKMLQSNKAIARHPSGASSINNMKVQFIRNLNFKYGEYIFDLKVNKFRFIKLFRQFSQSLIFFIISSLLLRKNVAIKNIAIFFGILKFTIFCLKK